MAFLVSEAEISKVEISVSGVIPLRVKTAKIQSMELFMTL